MASTSVDAGGMPSQSSKMKTLKTCKSLPTRLLDSQNAFKASIDMPPRFTIGKKISDPADREVRPGCQKYDIGKNMRTGIMTTPSWSMAPRASGIPKPPMVPGPGHYPLPGCIYGEHPTIEQPGRIPKSTTKRVDPQDWEPKDTPSPQDYNTQQTNTFGRIDQASAPKFSIRTKLKDPTSKEKRPGCQTYDIKNLSNRGPMTTPSWSMMARAAGIPSPPKVPGPGEYVLPGSIYGAHPSIKQPGRVPKTTAKRFVYDEEERPY